MVFHVNMVFFIFVFIFLYGYYSCIRVLFIRRQQTLLESSLGVIEADHSGTQQGVSEPGSLSLSMLCGCDY